jgi:hypothetical protein
MTRRVSKVLRTTSSGTVARLDVAKRKLKSAVIARERKQKKEGKRETKRECVSITQNVPSSKQGALAVRCS